MSEKIEKIKFYTDEQIEKMNTEEVKNKFKELQSIAHNGQEVIELLNKMKKRYKIALYMVIRNSIVSPTGIKLGKTEKEINRMAYETMCEVITMINFTQAEKIYEQAKEGSGISE